MSVIREMIQRVENEQRGKLEQLNSVQNEQKYVRIIGLFMG